ncbi:unnamed protein product, partial [Amoebophrya sp. A25]|eukprot:GSA25T00025989001.1
MAKSSNLLVLASRVVKSCLADLFVTQSAWRKLRIQNINTPYEKHHIVLHPSSLLSKNTNIT